MIQYQELNQPLYPMHVTWNTVKYGRFSHIFEDKDTIFWVEEFYDLTYEFFSCVDNVVNQILTKFGQLVQ